MHTTIAEWEYYAFVDLVDMLDEDMTYMKGKVSRILDAAKNNQPIEEGDEEDDTKKPRRKFSCRYD